MTSDTKGVRSWPLFIIAAPAAVAIWSGWVGLGTLSGFGVIHPLPGIWPAFRVNTAITLPVGVEAYGAYALGAWLRLGSDHPARLFARRSAIGSLILGVTGQVIYHLLSAAHSVRAPWPVVVIVSCLPVITLGFGAALRHLLNAPEQGAQAEGTAPAAPAVPAIPAPPPPAAPDSPQSDRDGPQAPGATPAAPGSPRHRSGLVLAPEHLEALTAMGSTAKRARYLTEVLAITGDARIAEVLTGNGFPATKQAVRSATRPAPPARNVRPLPERTRSA